MGLQYDEQLPYFVYGTLRPGMGNSRCWGNWEATAQADGEVVVDGFAMYASGIPYAVPEDGSTIIGCLIIPPDDAECATGLRHSMDTLEGHPHSYERRLVQYRRKDEAQPAGHAWLYVWDRIPHGRRVESGDYLTYRVERDTIGAF